MSNNYHTPISPIAAVNAAIVNTPLGQLDAQLTTQAASVATVSTDLTNLKNGAAAMVQLNFGTPTTKVISSGAITIDRSYHIIDTEGAAATDDLTTISGGSDGDFLRLRIANNARVVTVKHLGLNVSLSSKADFTLDDTNKFIDLYYDNALGLWVQAASPINLISQDNITNLTAITTADGFIVPPGVIQSSSGLGTAAKNNRPFLSVQPRLAERKAFWINFINNTEQGMGSQAPTVAGTGSASNQADSTYNRYQSGAAAGNNGGIISQSFNYVQAGHKPSFIAYIRTHTSIAVCRIWIGLVSASIGNVDDLGGAGITGVVLRYSTVAGDANWRAISSDGAAQSNTDTGVAVATSTAFRVAIWWDEFSSAFKFRVNNGSVVSAGNVPGATTDLGYICRVETREAVAKSILISRLYCDHN